jgi:serine phosphatase RsbU (regulator of sigma subunit)
LYLYKSKEQKIEKLVPKGLVLGMGKLDLFNNNLEEMKFNICENDIILLVTDGIIEARNNKNEEFDEDKLLKVFEENVNNDVNEIRHNLIQSIQNFSQNVNQFDDLTVLIVRYNQLQNNQ